MSSIATEIDPIQSRYYDQVLNGRLSAVAGFLALLIYLATPTENYYWDGLAFALRIELVAKHAYPTSGLFHQNHLFYSAVGYLLYALPHWLGLSIRALTVLQIITALSCAIGIYIFFRIGQRIFSSLYVASLAAGLLTVSACWWKAATDADAYSLSVTLVLICASMLLGPAPRWYLAGLSLAAAMLIHELASLFYPAAVLFVLFSDQIKDRLKFALKFSVMAWGITILSYYAVAALVFGITGAVDVMEWARSNPYGVDFSNPLWTLQTFPRYQIDLIFGHSFKAFHRYGGGIEMVLAVVGAVVLCLAAIVGQRRGDFKEFTRSVWRVAQDERAQWRQAMPGLLVWVGTYALFLLAWEPYLLHYRLYYVSAVVMVLMLVLSNYHRRTSSPPSGAAALAVLALFLLNLAFFIAPHMRSNSNLLVAAARSANDKWDNHTVIYFNNSSPIDTAFQYFNGKTEWRGASAKAIMRLDEEIERIYSEGGNVWLNDNAVKSVSAEWLTRRALGEEFTVKLDNESYRYVQLLPVR